MIHISTITLIRYIDSIKNQFHYDVCMNMINAFSKMFISQEKYSTCITRINMAMQDARIKMVDSILEPILKEEII